MLSGHGFAFRSMCLRIKIAKMSGNNTRKVLYNIQFTRHSSM